MTKPRRVPLDLDLYEAVVEEAKHRFEVWPSAYASGWVVKTYKERGGKYAGQARGQDTGLTKWFGEEWVDLSRPIHDEDGDVVGYEPCGRKSSDDPADYPKCRPLAEAMQMTPEEVADAIRRKRRAERQVEPVEGHSRAPVMVPTYREDHAMRRNPARIIGPAISKAIRQEVGRNRTLFPEVVEYAYTPGGQTPLGEYGPARSIYKEDYGHDVGVNMLDVIDFRRMDDAALLGKTVKFMVVVVESAKYDPSVWESEDEWAMEVSDDGDYMVHGEVHVSPSGQFEITLANRRARQNPLMLDSVDDPLEPSFKKTVSSAERLALVYHGTSTTALWPILKSGLSFAESRKAWEGTSPGVFVAFDQNATELYASRAVQKFGGQPVCLVMEVPYEWLDIDVDDYLTHDKTRKVQAMVHKPIPPSSIVGVMFAEGMGWGPEIPVKRFIADAKKGKYVDEGIEPPTKGARFRTGAATRIDLEHAALNYLVDLLQYTSLADVLLQPEWGAFQRRVLEALVTTPSTTWLAWTGRDWLAFSENIIGEKNEEPYAEQMLAEPRFKFSIGRVLSKYGNDALDRDRMLGPSEHRRNPSPLPPGFTTTFSADDLGFDFFPEDNTPSPSLTETQQTFRELKRGDVVAVGKTKWVILQPLGSVNAHAYKHPSQHTKAYEIRLDDPVGNDTVVVFQIGGSGQRISDDLVRGPLRMTAEKMDTQDLKKPARRQNPGNAVQLHGDERMPYLDAVWSMYRKSYEKIGLIVGRAEELLSEYDVWEVTVDDAGTPIAFCLYKSTPYGLKVGLSGSDGSAEGRAAARASFVEKYFRPGVYGEVSHRPAELAKAAGAPVVCANVAATVLRKEIEPVDDVHYVRSLTNIGPVTKLLVGRPLNVPTTDINAPVCPAVRMNPSAPTRDDVADVDAHYASMMFDD